MNHKFELFIYFSKNLHNNNKYTIYKFIINTYLKKNNEVANLIYLNNTNSFVLFTNN